MPIVNTLYRLLQQAADKHGMRIALVDGVRELAYGQLYSSVNRIANGLRRLGLQRGQRVGVHLPKQSEEVVASLAIAAAGGVFVNIHVQSSPRQVRHIMQDCVGVGLITDALRLRKLDFIGELEDLRFVVVTDERSVKAVPKNATAWGELQRETDDVLPHPTISKDLAALLYTSGSTGQPKGVMVSHRNLLDGARVVSHYLGLGGDDRILSVPPLNFDYGLNQLLDALWVGCTLILQRVPMPGEIARSVEEQAVSVLPMVAPSWVQFLRLLQETPRELPHLRVATNTGGKIPRGLLREVPGLMPRVSFYLMYGLTESFRSTYLPPELFESKTGAIGMAVPDNEVFVINEEGLCAPGQTGELVHRGCLVSMGYWNQPDLTVKRIHPNRHLAPLIGDEPVVHSGDLVHRDADGVLWFEGRMDDMIKCSGFRISPTEVEDLASDLGHIRESVAFGVDHEELGQIVNLAVSMEESHFDEPKILDAFRKLAPTYMVPVKLHLFPAPFPRTASGKINRPQVVAACRDQRGTGG